MKDSHKKNKENLSLLRHLLGKILTAHQAVTRIFRILMSTYFRQFCPPRRLRPPFDTTTAGALHFIALPLSSPPISCSHSLGRPSSMAASLLHVRFTSPTVPSPVLRRSSCRPAATPTRIYAKIREIFMPALSSTMTEGKIVSWVKSEGDRLAKGESVVVVESDKADMDVETFYDGFLAAIMVEEGGVAPVGSAIALLAESEDEIPLAKSQASSSPSSPAIAPVADSPAPSEAPTPPPSQTVPPPRASSASASLSAHPASEGGQRIVTTPFAKKLAKELKVELAAVTGTGPQGRIVAKDVEAAAASGSTVRREPKTVAETGAAKVPTSPIIQLGAVVPFTTMQGAVSKNMVESLSVPTFRVGYTITTNALDELYKKIKSKGVTMTALLAKATAMALIKHPVVNSSCRDGKSFTYNSSINIAVAVAIDGGLITPVLQDADKVDIYSLSRKWKELVDKARAKQLQPHEYNTGTFTLSNLGMFGVDRFDAILPPGTGAIMAVGASQPTVVASKDGRIGLKNQMQLNVTADHRVIYGADLAAFLQTLAQIIENPKDLTM